ncbi:MAG TPA: Wzz/FepE/Etk N-terminal domain-containing protein, partial [Candidatus Avimonas sp.]|nr:Wzz/FepE/Etk N-terminal domain-containing protein [Candidatus Avimonas sp.]
MHQGYYIFNLKEAVQLIKQKMWFILLLSFCGFLIAFGITKVFLKPVYTSKVSFYVSNTEHLQNYSVIIQSDTVLSEVVSLS